MKTKKNSIEINMNALGFTLIETLMAILIVAVLAGVAGPLLSVTVDAISLHMERVHLNEAANIAFARMNREIRCLRDDESIVTAVVNQFEFINTAGTQIRYRVVGDALMRQENGGAESELVRAVPASGLIFNFYGDGDVLLTSPVAGLGTATDIRRVEIQLTFQDGTHVLPVMTGVKPRNLRHEADLFA